MSSVKGSNIYYFDRTDRDYLNMLLWDAYYRNDFEYLRQNLQTGITNWYTEAKEKITYPGAKKVCSKLSKSVFSAPPKITLEKSNQERFDVIAVSNSLFTKLRKGCEFGGALGKTYLKLSYDPDLDYPVVSIAYALNVEVTKRKWGVATEAKFYTFLKQEGTTQYWLCEYYHEDGTVENILLSGSTGTKKLDLRPIPLDDISETSGLDEEVNMGVDSSAFIEVVNPTTNNKNPDSYGGIAIFANATSQIDALNRVVHEYYKEYADKGAKVFFDETMFKSKNGEPEVDLDQSIYIKSIFDQGLAQNGKYEPVHVVNPEIRASDMSLGLKDHMALIYEASELSSGSSTPTKATESGEKTATEVSDNKEESNETKEDYQVVWQNAITKLIMLILEMDNGLYSGSNKLEGTISVDFQEKVKKEKLEKLAKIIELRKNNDISLKTLLEAVFPDWDEKRIQEELDRIEEEKPEELNTDLLFGAKGPQKATPKDDEKGDKDDDKQDEA